MTDTACTIIIVDDDAGLRDSLNALLSAKGYPCRVFSDAEAFLSAPNTDLDSIVLMDYSLGAVSGLEAIRRMRAQDDLRPVIMITAHGDVALAVEAMRTGASDFIEKPWDKNALFEAIERVEERAHAAARLSSDRAQAVSMIESFTPREREVFEQLITGASNKIVARELDISPRTVEYYRANVFQKASVSSVAELVRLAFIARLDGGQTDTL